MQLPKSWNDISLEQFIELAELDKNEFDSLIEYNVLVLSILLDEDIDVFEEMELDELNELMKKVNFIRSYPSKNHIQKLGHYTFKPFEKLSLGEFIDIEHYFKDGIKNLSYICAILFKKVKIDEWSNINYEPYTYDLNTRQELFLDIPITDVFNIWTSYSKFRENFVQTYQPLFSQKGDGDDEEMDEMTAEEKKQADLESRYSKWAWENMVYSLANEDITKVNEITDMPLIFVFNMVSMKEELSM